MNYFQLAQEITRPRIPLLELFKKLVEKHDLTYEYSDDIDAYQRGAAEFSRIDELQQSLNVDEVAEIWNAEVNRKIKGKARREYYWMNSKGKIPLEEL